MRPYRQGDVLIVPTKKRTIPKNAKKVARDRGRVVLAYGEVTGHAHVVDGPCELFTSADLTDMDSRFLRVEAECAVVHEEHDTITLPAGIFEVRRQREYTSADMAPMRVAD